MARKMDPALGHLAKLAYPLLRLMPVRLASELMAAAGARLAGRAVRLDAMRRNLRSAFPELDDAALDDMTRRIVANFGRQVAEVVHIPSFASGTRGARLEAAGAMEFPSGGKGPAIYVSGHLGNWELIPIVFRRHAVPVTIIYTKLAHPGIDARLLELRRATGATYVEKADALRACVRALARGESIALLVDQRVESGIEVEFFGRPTRFTHLPARMALKFGCPIVPAETVRIGAGHLKAVFHEPIWPGPERGDAAARDLTQRMAGAIEACIRRHPDEWFCNKRRWKKKDEQASDAPAQVALGAAGLVSG